MKTENRKKIYRKINNQYIIKPISIASDTNRTFVLFIMINVLILFQKTKTRQHNKTAIRTHTSIHTHFNNKNM